MINNKNGKSLTRNNRKILAGICEQAWTMDRTKKKKTDMKPRD